LRPAGAAWLVRVEDDDPTIPWFIPANSANCQVIAPAMSMVAPPQGQNVDCFDFQTLASMVLATIALDVTEAAETAEIPFLPGATGAATNHRLHVVPYLPSPAGDPGFGLIYSVDIIVSMLGQQLAKTTIQVPISMYFSWDGEFAIDPLSGLMNSRNPARVTATYGDGLFDEDAARRIRTNTVDALVDTMLPPLASGIAVEEGFLLLFNLVSGRSPIAPEDFAIIALPEQRSTDNTTITNNALSIPQVTRTVTTPATDDLTPGVTVNPDGTVTVIPSSVATIFTIPRPTVHNQFKLVFLQ
jgi:hypothetical protein